MIYIPNSSPNCVIRKDLKMNDNNQSFVSVKNKYRFHEILALVRLKKILCREKYHGYICFRFPSIMSAFFHLECP